MDGREAVEGEQVLLGVGEQAGDLGRRAGQVFDDLAGAVPGRRQAVGVEDLRRAADTIPRWVGRQ
jgi:hypothetical protein